jgi:ribonuclease Z
LRSWNSGAWDLVAIEYQILGEPGRDNALLATVDSGQSVHHLLFDCGQACLSQVPAAQVGEIEALFFSHFHMDHVAGFDSFFRANWCRPDRPVRVFGPPGTIDIIHHRMRGFIWNLSTDSPGEWIVSEIGDRELRGARFFASEGFAQRHAIGSAALQPGAPIHSGKTFEIGAIALDHGTPSMGYVVREHDHSNVGSGRLEELGMQPGPWLKTLKDRGTSDDARIEVQGVTHRAGELRAQLLETGHGDSIAYLTDFRLNPGGDDGDRLVHFLSGCQTMVCENNYRNAEAVLAAKHHHMTSAEVAGLAARVGPERLILFHLSDRYTVDDWNEQLAEVRSRFARAEFPPQWF